MNILIISDYDRLPVEIAKSFISRGYNTELLTTKDTDIDFAVNISKLPAKKLWSKNASRSFFFRKIYLKSKPRYSYFQDINENSDYYNISKIKSKLKNIPDIIIILFDYRVLTTKTIKDLYKWSKARIFWMIPDMKPMTGGCSYAADCVQYQSACNSCPAIGNEMAKNFAAKTLKKKIANLSSLPIEIISGSTYQEEQAKKSSLFKQKKIHKLYFPSNSDVFKSVEQSKARAKFDIITDKKIIMFGSISLEEERKGMKFILEALKNIEQEYKDKSLLLIVGNGESKAIQELAFENKMLGFVSYEELASAYQAADFFICPTIDDSGPVMVSQSIMCGTPVVSFQMGISLDVIQNDFTGVICEVGNQEELTKGIVKMLNQSKEDQLCFKKNCSSIAPLLGFDHFFSKLNKIINE